MLDKESLFEGVDKEFYRKIITFRKKHLIILIIIIIAIIILKWIL